MMRAMTNVIKSELVHGYECCISKGEKQMQGVGCPWTLDPAFKVIAETVLVVAVQILLITSMPCGSN